MSEELLRPITTLSGIGEKKAILLKNLGLNTVGDVLRHYPTGYEDRRKLSHISDAVHGERLLFVATVKEVKVPPYAAHSRGKGKTNIPMKVIVSDDWNSITLIFFNHKYLRNSFARGREYIFYGSVQRDFAGFSIVHPEFEIYRGADSLKILPVYPLTAGVPQIMLRKLTQQVMPLADAVPALIPAEVEEDAGLAPLGFSLKNIHHPSDEVSFKRASYRIIFEEFFMFRIALLWARGGRDEARKGIVFSSPKDGDTDGEINRFEELLPFKLTSAQRRVITEIWTGMQSERPMHRLIQGDVGSGKTAVAFAAIIKAAGDGRQSALMAPTEILATQHYQEAEKVLGKAGLNIGFLSSATAGGKRKKLADGLVSGEIDVLIGTHAIIEENVVFNNLSLVITDEQHRFGVTHRLRLRDKGISGDMPDVLIMTATPIPRSLSMVFYGDIDSSVLDELPPGRKPIRTKLLAADGRQSAYDFARKQMESGRQVYVVASAIEADEDSEYFADSCIKTVTELYDEMSENFPDYNIGILHGRMKSREKDEIMESFASGNTDMLVSTTVIEVGISVSNARLMIVENSERFGLAQLHQLRGRVGRGEGASYCIMLNYSKSDDAKERGEILVNSTDGFEIAEKDLLLRGPGDLLGTRQHGLPELRLADFSRHAVIMEKAGAAAKRLLSEDPTLTKSGHENLRNRLDEMELIG